jgi:DNA-binding GntR family transcriptional regulator
LYDFSLRLWYLVLNHLDDVREAVDQHQKVLDALKEGDGARAEALIQTHIVEFQQNIKAAL